MLRNQWGRRSYANALAETEGGLIPEGAGQPDGQQQRRIQQARARRQGEDLQREASNKKFFFQQKLFLEGKRKQLGKGNIATFLMSDGRQGIEQDEINKVLRVAGFIPDQIVTIKLNDFRANQVEVLFKPDVVFDTQVVEEKLQKEKIEAIVSKFDYIEEFLMIYGLPPTFDIEVLKLKIVESLTPFVKKIVEITPCIHRSVTKNDFFDGKYDGNWRLKVIPKSKVQVPNFIVVGNDAQVMAKAVYTKKIGGKEEMCADCFRTGHFKNDCPGARKWMDYCQEFKENWEKLSLDESEEDSEPPADKEEARLVVLNKTLVKTLQRIESEKDEYLNRLNNRSNLEERVEALDRNVKELDSAKKQSDDKVDELTVALEKQKKEWEDLQRQKNELEIKLHNERAMIEKSFRRNRRMSTGGMKDFIDLFDESVFREELTESECVSDDSDDNEEGSDVAAGLEVSDTAVLASTDVDSSAISPMHGFSSSDKSDSLVTNIAKIVDTAEANVEEFVSNSQKRNLSPEVESVNKHRKGIDQPELGSGSCIWVTNISGQDEYIIHSKSNKNSSKYKVVDKKGNKLSLTLDDLDWGVIEKQ
jgi:hypothetical protein